MIDINSMSVLIVDDMPLMCSMIKKMLKMINYGKKAQIAYNGVQAMELLKENKFDAAIIDLNMPIMNGLELLYFIRGEKNLRDMPVLMVTAEASREIVAEAAESDVDTYLLKPITMEALGSRIKKIIENANNPPLSLVHLRKARDFDESGNIDLAVTEAIKAAKASPESSRPLRELGMLFNKKGSLDKAVQFLLKAIKINKLDIFSLNCLGEIYIKKNDLDNAELFFCKAMNLSKRYISPNIQLGRLFLEKKMTDRATKIFDEIIDTTNSLLSVQEEIAEICIENGFYQYAIPLLEAVNIKTKTQKADILFKLGVAFEKTGDNNKALSYLLEAEKKDKINVNIKILIAKIYVDLKQIIRADEALKNVLKIDPQNEKAIGLLRNNL